MAGIVNVNRAPQPTPPLSARMRPPCASTSPFEIARPRPVPPGRSGPLAEQVRDLVGRDPPALVRHVHRDEGALARALDLDRRRGRRTPRSVREQVAEHLHDALRIGQYARQVGREVDQDGISAAAGYERGAGLVDQRSDVRGLGLDGERPRLDASRVEQISDQAPHVVGPAVDDAEELDHLGLGRGRGTVEHGRRRALDRGQRRAQFVAHHPEELRALPLKLLERPEILHRHDHRHHLAVIRADGRCVDERANAPPIRNRQLDLLGAHRPGILELRGQGKLFERVLPPVGKPAGHHLEKLFGGTARRPDLLDDAARLAVERERVAGGGIEDNDPDRRGFDERFEVRARALHLAVCACVCDRRRRLRGEEEKDLLVFGRKRLVVLFVAHEEVPEMLSPVVHRGPL